MKIICVFLMLALTALQVNAATAPKTKKISVPETLSSLRPISASANGVNHVLLVNVAEAVNAAEWPLVSNFAASRIQINIWTNSIGKTLFPQMLSDKSEFISKFGNKAKIAVFLENNDTPETYQTAQGSWCRVNLKQILNDAPDCRTRRDRIAKAILKGIAYAAGCGAGYDNMSVTGYKTLTVAGLDAAGICITPETYFPMLESLRSIGGNEMLSPVISR